MQRNGIDPLIVPLDTVATQWTAAHVSQLFVSPPSRTLCLYTSCGYV